ncbi:dimethylamine monooxygenase subunit DmmA family protein [Acetobacter sp.]|jgi:hypothetical protein|uniref:dimethylamine monooxygenase subunit DmmA family protein n=1 Tax=Acetobacter sp. TaxID=440 RepID=UPI0025B7B5FA|nr:dimethylamine monooxygenase subunit DmmA family protein [Acetobacter sp.]MCH4092046.1 hypothetical protein [Acetobacter sp.]MCI1300699.1 hypothetical protein [Acetobacter sp.]MCI1317634.1 hypothetical protein [Acetobacter sp.]
MGTSELPYRPLTFDPDGRRHLFVRENAVLALPEGERPSLFEIWTIEHSSLVKIDPNTCDVRMRSIADLLERLAYRLAREKVGLRLYAAGQPVFLGQVAKLADDAGLCSSEILLGVPSGSERRVFCVHCDTLHDGVSGDKLMCRGCATELSVRDHYSRSLGAYMGAGEPAVVVEAMEVMTHG